MNSESKYVLGVEVGGSHISTALIDAQGKMVESSFRNLKVDSGKDKEAILDKWAMAMNHSIARVGQENLKGISFAMPGPFNYLDGVALFKGNSKYEALCGISIPEELTGRLRIKKDVEMRFLNDATSFAVGAAWQGKAKDTRKALFITLGTGCGSAFIENGLPIVHRADVPSEGCLWHLPFRDTRVDDYFSSRWFVDTARKKYDLDITGVKSLARAGRKHQHVQDIFNEFGANLGEMLKPWVEKFSPEMVLFGGSIAKAFDLFSPKLKEQLNKFNLSLEFTENSEKEALIGSTRLFEEDFWKLVRAQLPAL